MDPYYVFKQQIRHAFLQMNSEIEANVPNCQFSGTTCSLVLARGPQMVSVNAGDSRGIIVDKYGVPKQLSRDHKPDSVDESRRIIKTGGRIRPLINQSTGKEVGPARVWLPEMQAPGLAMSRSLGDYVAQSVGVSPDPGKFHPFLTLVFRDKRL